MRIAYLSSCGQMGGAETSLLELLAGIRATQPDWELTLVAGEDGPLPQKAEMLGVAAVVVPLPTAIARAGESGRNAVSVIGSSLLGGGAAWTYARRLADVLRSIQPQVIHTNGFKMHLLGSWSRPAGTPVVWHMHDYMRARKVTGRLLRGHQSRCTAVIANSHSVASDVRRQLPRLPVVTAYSAVDLERFNSPGPKLDLDALARLPPAMPDTVRVGLVATFARWKGHAVYLRALSLLPRQLAVRGYVIGGPIYQTRGSQWTLEELRAEAAGLGLRGKVGFTGPVENAAAAMRSLDIIVHASTQPEPFGMVIAEGMACGKAVIVSMAGGATELAAVGENALGHAPGDAAALAEQITRLTSNENLRFRLGQAGRSTAERMFQRGRLGQQMTTLYRQVGGDGEVRGALTKSLAHCVAVAEGQRAIRRSALATPRPAMARSPEWPTGDEFDQAEANLAAPDRTGKAPY